MGDYYRRFLTSVSGMEGYFASDPDDLNLSLGTGIPVPLSSTGPPATHPIFEHMGVFQEPVLFHATRPSRGRRKLVSGLGSGADAVKHRRTRSGCFMCRSRRVKCDETHPVCERCKKGNRDCVYPDPPASKGASSQNRTKDSTLSTHQSSPKVSNDGEEDETEQESRLGAISFEDESTERSPSARSCSQGPGIKNLTCSNAPRLAISHSLDSSAPGPARQSPTTSTAATRVTCSNTAQPDELSLPIDGRLDWSHLPADFQHHLEFFVTNITNHHYSIANDGDDFFSIILPSMAVQHQPLLHAVVGFSAYHATLQNPDGQLQDFLKYYNGGVTLLLEYLQRKETNNVPVLVTILQLATMEEFLGDWVNLMGHQKAAFEVITHIFEPETVMDTAVGRMCLNWYSRYDNYVAIMGGFPTELPREWFDVTIEHCRSQAAAHPGELRWQIDHRSARLRLITFDMSMLYARGSRGQISPEDFNQEHERLTHQLQDWRDTWEPALMDPKYLVTDLSYQKRLGPGDIVDPYKPGILFEPPLFTTTLITAEWHSIMIMHLSQSATLPPAQLFGKLREHAYAACQYFESVEVWPPCPPGALISLQPCVSIAALFLPRDAQHQMWIRRKFAHLDTLGFIHPTARRIKMAKVFRDPTCTHWWLPNDEGLTPILQSIRTFADERNAAAVDAQLENIREVRHLFVKLELGDQEDEAQGTDAGAP